jgi:hypothetical protein
MVDVALNLDVAAHGDNEGESLPFYIIYIFKTL